MRKKFQDFKSKTNAKDTRIKFPPTGGGSAESLNPVEKRLVDLLDAKNSVQLKGINKGIDTLVSLITNFAGLFVTMAFSIIILHHIHAMQCYE